MMTQCEVEGIDQPLLTVQTLTQYTVEDNMRKTLFTPKVNEPEEVEQTDGEIDNPEGLGKTNLPGGSLSWIRIN